MDRTPEVQNRVIDERFAVLPLPIKGLLLQVAEVIGGLDAQDAAWLQFAFRGLRREARSQPAEARWVSMERLLGLVERLLLRSGEFRRVS